MLGLRTLVAATGAGVVLSGVCASGALAKGRTYRVSLQATVTATWQEDRGTPVACADWSSESGSERLSVRRPSRWRPGTLYAAGLITGGSTSGTITRSATLEGGSSLDAGCPGVCPGPPAYDKRSCVEPVGFDAVTPVSGCAPTTRRLTAPAPFSVTGRSTRPGRPPARLSVSLPYILTKPFTSCGSHLYGTQMSEDPTLRMPRLPSLAVGRTLTARSTGRRDCAPPTGPADPYRRSCTVRWDVRFWIVRRS